MHLKFMPGLLVPVHIPAERSENLPERRCKTNYFHAVGKFLIFISGLDAGRYEGLWPTSELSCDPPCT